jgi:hypothetical protein
VSRAGLLLLNDFSRPIYSGAIGFARETRFLSPGASPSWSNRPFATSHRHVVNAYNKNRAGTCIESALRDGTVDSVTCHKPGQPAPSVRGRLPASVSFGIRDLA